MSGKNMVGVMVAMANGEFDKNMYRKFIIRSVDRSNDTAALQEVLKRRFNHPEWPMPDVMLIDGGKGQINAVQKVLDQVKKRQEELGDVDITWPTIISVVKDDRHKAREILNKEALNTLNQMSEQLQDDIIRLNAEAHRFAITFHKKKRSDNQGFLPR
jgi:excinuclease ABC subunit C